jgi:hypothetical protein
MLSTCQGCDETYDGMGDFCPHCRIHGLCEAGRERNDFAARLMSASAVQRDWLMQTMEAMEDFELKQVILRMFEYCSPVERSVLLTLCAETLDVRPFKER